MGVKSISAWGFKITFKSADASDQDKIEQFIAAAGFDKAKGIVDSKPQLREATNAAGGFPDYKAGLEDWFDEMTPEQGSAIVAAFEEVST